MKLGALQEPRGYIKVIELILCIVSFAVIASYSSCVQIEVECYRLQLSQNVTDIFVGENETLTFEIDIYYPFKFAESSTQTCGRHDVSLKLEDKTSSHAVFFMFVGVVTFMFILVMIPVYVFQEDICANATWFPVEDMTVHLVFVILWLSASISWSNGLANLRVATSTDNVILNNEICYDFPCVVSSEPTLSKLVISVVFGFATLMTFTGNLWLVYKETAMYKNKT